MTRPSARTVTTAGVTGGAGGVVVAVLAAGWVGATLLIIAILAPIAAICWVLADSDRPQRLALLLTTWRHSETPPPHPTLPSGNSANSGLP